MNIDTWAVVAATALGPVSAVMITLWLEERRSRYSRRLSAFRVLMSTRRTGVSSEHVGALNLVEVDFYGVRNVEAAWKEYKKHLNSDPAKDLGWGELKERLLADLLFQISKNLKFNIPAIEIFKGGYAPVGWQFRDEKTEIGLRFIADLASGTRDFPVKVKHDAS